MSANIFLMYGKDVLWKLYAYQLQLKQIPIEEWIRWYLTLVQLIEVEN